MCSETASCMVSSARRFSASAGAGLTSGASRRGALTPTRSITAFIGTGLISAKAMFISGMRADKLARYPNVYADTSGVRRFDYIVEAVKRAGPHKLIFGSDGPWLHPAVELYKIRVLGLPQDRKALILGGNITRLLRRRGRVRNPV
jgi:hypothetical protein